MKNITKLLILFIFLTASAALLCYGWQTGSGRSDMYLFMEKGLLSPARTVLLRYILFFLTACFSEYRKRAISILFACLYIAYFVFSLREPLFYHQEMIDTCFIYKYLPYFLDMILLIPYCLLSSKNTIHLFNIPMMIVALLMLAYLDIDSNSAMIRYYSNYYLLGYELLGVGSMIIRYWPSDRKPRRKKVYVSGYEYLDEYKRNMRGQS